MRNEPRSGKNIFFLWVSAATFDIEDHLSTGQKTVSLSSPGHAVSLLRVQAKAGPGHGVSLLRGLFLGASEPALWQSREPVSGFKRNVYVNCFF